MTYHNTLAHDGDQLREYQAKALRQDDVILAWFEERYSYGFTPSAINLLVLPNAPLTSVRRSLNTLTNEGKLVKTDETRNSEWGRPEHVWRLAYPVQKVLF